MPDVRCQICGWEGTADLTARVEGRKTCCPQCESTFVRIVEDTPHVLDEPLGFEFRILNDQSLLSLETEVKLYIGNGWNLHGSPFADREGYFYQGVTKG